MRRLLRVDDRSGVDSHCGDKHVGHSVLARESSFLQCAFQETSADIRGHHFAFSGAGAPPWLTTMSQPSTVIWTDDPLVSQISQTGSVDSSKGNLALVHTIPTYSEMSYSGNICHYDGRINISRTALAGGTNPTIRYQDGLCLTTR